MAAALGALGNGTGPGAGPGPAAPPAAERALGSGRGARPGERHWLRAAASSPPPRPCPASPHITPCLPRGRPPPFLPRFGLSPSRRFPRAAPSPRPASRGCPQSASGRAPAVPPPHRLSPSSPRCPGRALSWLPAPVHSRGSRVLPRPPRSPGPPAVSRCVGLPRAPAPQPLPRAPARAVPRSPPGFCWAAQAVPAPQGQGR
ncbi:uncharacterized protein [Agelaius tricolor]|uniref:uncharacterized protein n=1 Tax=Agelaius tricolor TaxID=9191 RepID=UPI0039F1721D